MDKREASQFSIDTSVSAKFMGIGVGVDSSYATQKYMAQQMSSYLKSVTNTKKRFVCK